MNESGNNQRNMVSILYEIKNELKAFFDTRIEMFGTEIKENISHFKRALPAAIIAGLLLVLAGLFFGLSLVGLVSVAFLGNPYAWFLAFLIVGFTFSLAGSIVGFIAWKALRRKSLIPRTTFEVLRNDKFWLKQEMRKQA